MIVSAPGRKNRGARTHALTEFVDIYPSLCELSGLETPGHCEGTSFVPLIENPGRKWKSAAFSQYPRGKVMGYSVRTKRYRYTEWQDRKTKKPLARELYDHVNDPGENANIAGKAQMEDIVERLSRVLNAGYKDARPK